MRNTDELALSATSDVMSVVNSNDPRDSFGMQKKAKIQVIIGKAIKKSQEYGKQVTSKTIEQIEEEVSMGHNAWDMVDPIDLVNAVIRICLRSNQAGACGCPACKITLHDSDCAVHNGPAMPIGECNCK